MKNLNLFVLLFFVAQIGYLSAQETEIILVPDAGKGLGEGVAKPLKDLPKKKHLEKRVVLKADIGYTMKKGIGFEVEVPIDSKSSFIFCGGWRPLNNHIAYRRPGAYQNTYAVTDVETTWWFFGPITSSYTTTFPKPFPEIGEYLLTSVVPLQASIRSYEGNKKRNHRVFIQPGFRVLFLKGLHVRDEQILLNETTTEVTYTGNTFSGYDATYTKTTVRTYQETRITSPAVHITVFGFALDFGWRFQHKSRLTMDLGLRTGWNLIEKTLGVKQVYITPMVNIGFGI